LLKEMYYS